MFWDKLKRNEVWLALAIIFFVAISVTGLVVDNYLDTDGLTIIDRPINQLIVSLRTPLLNRLMFLITLTGNWQMIALGSLLSVILLVAAKKRRYLLALLLSNFSALTFIELSKNIIGRTRPPVENALILEHGFAFPSGHSYFAVAFYGLLTYFWVRHFHHKLEKIAVFLLGSSFILLLALSRIYLGVHWSTDVIAGLSSSVTFLAIIVAYIEFRRRYFVEEYRQFNKRNVWAGFGMFAFVWVAGLAWLYSNNVITLGAKIITPISAEQQATINTAPAAKSRAKVVSEY